MGTGMCLAKQQYAGTTQPGMCNTLSLSFGLPRPSFSFLLPAVRRPCTAVQQVCRVCSWVQLLLLRSARGKDVCARVCRVCSFKFCAGPWCGLISVILGVSSVGKAPAVRLGWFSVKQLAVRSSVPPQHSHLAITGQTHGGGQPAKAEGLVGGIWQPLPAARAARQDT